MTSRGQSFLPHAGLKPHMVEWSPSGLYTSVFSLLFYCGESFLQKIDFDLNSINWTALIDIHTTYIHIYVQGMCVFQFIFLSINRWYFISNTISWVLMFNVNTNVILSSALVCFILTKHMLHLSEIDVN